MGFDEYVVARRATGADRGEAAAETIEVGPGGRRWVRPAVAAAAVGAVAVTLTLAAVVPDGDAGPATPATSTTAAGEPTWGAWPLPGVEGLDEAQARDLLVARGYDVRTEGTGMTGCGLESGDAAGTEPPAGTVLAPGTAVTVRVAGPRLNPDGTSSFGTPYCVADHQDRRHRPDRLRELTPPDVNHDVN